MGNRRHAVTRAVPGIGSIRPGLDAVLAASARTSLQDQVVDRRSTTSNCCGATTSLSLNARQQQAAIYEPVPPTRSMPCRAGSTPLGGCAGSGRMGQRLGLDMEPRYRGAARANRPIGGWWSAVAGGLAVAHRRWRNSGCWSCRSVRGGGWAGGTIRGRRPSRRQRSIAGWSRCWPGCRCAGRRANRRGIGRRRPATRLVDEDAAGRVAELPAEIVAGLLSRPLRRRRPGQLRTGRDRTCLGPSLLPRSAKRKSDENRHRRLSRIGQEHAVSLADGNRARSVPGPHDAKRDGHRSPTPRIAQLCKIYQPKKITQAALEIVDTPGLCSHARGQCPEAGDDPRGRGPGHRRGRLSAEPMPRPTCRTSTTTC